MTTPKVESSLSNIFNVELQEADPNRSIVELQAEAQAKAIDSLEKHSASMSSPIW